jgi:hypothetical protein
MLLLFFLCVTQILNNVNGDLDAKRACAVALKLHKKYLRKVIICGEKIITFFFQPQMCTASQASDLTQRLFPWSVAGEENLAKHQVVGGRLSCICMWDLPRPQGGKVAKGSQEI